MGKKKKYKSESEYFQSEDFQKNIQAQIQADTWDKGLPMIFMNDEKQIVKHWKDGTIEIIG